MTLLDGWREEPLEAHAVKNKGRIVSQNNTRQGVPYIGSVAFDGVIDAYTEDENAVFCNPENVLILWDGEYAGKSVTGMTGAVSSTVVKLDLSDNLDNGFLHYSLQRDQNRIRHVREGSGVPHMPKDFLRWYKLNLPPIEEQEEIAEILGAVDAAIDATQGVIDQTARTKKALMTALLTHGLPGRHAKFKPSPLGDIPEGWEVTDLGEMIKESRYGTSEKCNDDSSKLPVLRIPNIVNGVLDTTNLKYTQLSENEVKRLKLKTGDLLLIRTNGNPDYVGRMCIIPEDITGTWLFASYLIRVRFDVNRMLPDYAYLLLQHGPSRKPLRRSIRTSAGNYNLNTQGLSSTPVSVPPLAEQKEIIEIVSFVQEREDAENNKLTQLKKLKTALMQALLTGTVRVPVQTTIQHTNQHKEVANG